MYGVLPGYYDDDTTPAPPVQQLGVGVLAEGVPFHNRTDNIYANGLALPDMKLNGTGRGFSFELLIRHKVLYVQCALTVGCGLG